MDKRNLLDRLIEIMVDEPLPEDAPVCVKLSREMIIFSARTSENVSKICDEENDVLCAKIYAIMSETNSKILALCNGEQEAEKSVELKVGQRVQFKTWEELVSEFGIDSRGDIAGGSYFTENMKHLCGTKATIQAIDGSTVTLTDCEDKTALWYFINSCVLKPVKEVR